MAATKSENPVSDLMFDWLTVLQSKAEGLAAYEKYIRDAEKADAKECAVLLRKIHEQDVKTTREIKDHVFKMIAEKKGL